MGTATGAEPPSPSRLLVPTSTPKTCPSQNAGPDITQGAKRAWGQGMETCGDTEEGQQQGESLRHRAEPPWEGASALSQSRDRNKPLFFLSS